MEVVFVIIGYPAFWLSTYFFEKTPEIFHFLTSPLEIPGKAKLYPWKFNKIVLDPLEIPKPKTKTPGNFHIIFSLGQPLESPLCF